MKKFSEQITLDSFDQTSVTKPLLKQKDLGAFLYLVSVIPFLPTYTY